MLSQTQYKKRNRALGIDNLEVIDMILIRKWPLLSLTSLVFKECCFQLIIQAHQQLVLVDAACKHNPVQWIILVNSEIFFYWLKMTGAIGHNYITAFPQFINYKWTIRTASLLKTALQPLWHYITWCRYQLLWDEQSGRNHHKWVCNNRWRSLIGTINCL